MKNIKFNTIICKDCGSGFTPYVYIYKRYKIGVRATPKYCYYCGATLRK